MFWIKKDNRVYLGIKARLGGILTALNSDDAPPLSQVITLIGDGKNTAITRITAYAGGGQANATELINQFTEVTTVATVGDSVKLPIGSIGLVRTVKNTGATAMDVFPPAGGTINVGATNTAIRVSVYSTVRFVCVDGVSWKADQDFISASNGTAANPSHTFRNSPDMGLYRVSATQMGISVAGVLQAAWDSVVGGLAIGTITELIAGAGITFAKAIIRKHTATALNTTGAITAAQLAGGLITSTTAAGVTGTLPTATLLATQLGATQGTIFDFIVDNSAGANTFTVAVNTGITVGTTAVTGGDSLTVSTAQVTATFRLIFTSATAAILRRIS